MHPTKERFNVAEAASGEFEVVSDEFIYSMRCEDECEVGWIELCLS